MKITDTMAAFVGGEASDMIADAATRLQTQWFQSTSGRLAPTFSLLWAGMAPRWAGAADDLISALITPTGQFDRCRLEQLSFAAAGGGTLRRTFTSAVLVECSFAGLKLTGSNFAGSWLESCNFSDCDLTDTKFFATSVLDMDVSGAKLTDADFRGTDASITIRSLGADYSGDDALGFLWSEGALADEVPLINVARVSPSYEIARKVARELLKPGPSQFMGLTQRGLSAKDPSFAKGFVELLATLGFIAFDKSGSARTAEVVRDGRQPLMALADDSAVDPTLIPQFVSKTVLEKLSKTG